MTKRKLTIPQLESELRSMFEERRKADPSFSIRSFAIRIGLNESTLQKVFRGERHLGHRVAQEVATRLDFDVIKTSQPRKRAPKGWSQGIPAESPVAVSWLHLTILEMLKLRDFEPSEAWIARRLELPKNTVAVALQKMEANHLLDRSTEKWIDLLSDASTGHKGYASTATIRQTIKEVIELSKAKIDLVPFEKREHGFSIIPISVKQLPKLKEKIRKFRWELAEMSQKSKVTKTEIYTLQVGFFPLTQIESE